MALPTLRTQYPNVPKETADRDEDVPFWRVTLRMEMSLMTGAVMVVMRRRTVATRRKNVPTWWKIPVTAIAKGLLVVDLGEGD